MYTSLDISTVCNEDIFINLAMIFFLELRQEEPLNIT